MNDLDAEQRSLFDAARADYEPNEENRKKVLSGVLLRAGVAAGVTSAASAGAAAAGIAGAPLAGTTASPGLVVLAWKITLWMAIGGAIGVGGYEISRPLLQGAAAIAQIPTATGTSTSVASKPQLSSPGVVRLSASLELPGPPASPPAPEPNGVRLTGAQRQLAASAALPVSPEAQGDRSAQPAIAPQAPAVAAFPGDGSPATPASGSAALALSVEARGLATVQRALKEGRNAEALQLVEEQRQQFAHGELQQERDAARIVALCAVGRVADARSAARDFLSNSPRSPFAARIRASCAGGP
jgi:hypothetical protein